MTYNACYLAMSKSRFKRNTFFLNKKDFKKNPSLSFDYSILEKALNQALDGRLHILEKITSTIDTPREQLKPQTPKIIKLEVPKSAIGGIIGPGGKIIQELQAATSTNISIEEVDEKGVVENLGTEQNGIDNAIKKIEMISFLMNN